MNDINYIKKFSVVIPTKNGGEYLNDVLNKLRTQSKPPEEIIVIDSGSTDHTVSIAEQYQCKVYCIKKEEFNHGGTRNLGVMMSQGEFVVLMTQDAIPANSKSFENLLIPFDNLDVAAVCGRQLPHSRATPLAAHARLFNYPSKCAIKDQTSISNLGIKVAFISNAFAVYRRSVFEKIGGFPMSVIFGEDMCLTAKMVLAGYKIGYKANACVYHSHNYSVSEEFKRYFDIGVFYKKEKWLLREFGKIQGEGRRFVFSELKYLRRNHRKWIPRAALHTLSKYFGYKMGFYSQFLPPKLKKHLSMNSAYWDQFKEN